MTTRYWIGVVGLGHVQHAEKTGICAFSHGKKSAVQKLSDGDRFIYYSPKTGFPTGDPVQKFTALGTVIDATPFETTWDGYDLWAAKAAYAAITPADVRPLLEPLEFVRNPVRWGMAFRRSMFEITEADFTRIETVLKSTQT
jgi:predicted RNA-binding protein